MTTITTQKQIRSLFWKEYQDVEGISRKRYVNFGNEKHYNCTTRTAFTVFIDYLAREALISENLANRATL